ncbi:MAG TPA: CAP domain-containing protein [Methylomirabilota bacterium]|nr:CAP domain-containing protein [Methylomirabilota bacterium]
MNIHSNWRSIIGCAAALFAVSSAHSATLTGFTVDTSSREEVRNFFNAIYPVSQQLELGWTGNYATGAEGTISAQFRDATQLRINFLRAMAGVPANVTFRSDWSAKAQKAAYMMSLKGQLDHFPGDDPASPPETWPSWSEEGYEAAGKANLFLGTTNLDPISGAIDGYIADYGPGNERVGHRRWMFFPQSTTMGIGHVPGDDLLLTPGETFTLQQANAVWVIDDQTFFNPRPAVRDGFVAWPPKGNVPYQLVYPRWSLSYPKADFSQASVTLRRNGQVLNVTIEDRAATGVGENSIVWRHPDMPDFQSATRTEADVLYEVTVSNVKLGNTTTNFTYNVIMFDPAVPGPDTVLPALSGPENPFVGKTNLYAVTAPANVTSYELRSFQRQAFNLADGAEGGLGNWTPTLPLAFTGLNTQFRSSGSNSFWLGHLANPLPKDAFLTLPQTLLVKTNTSVSFRSRHGVAFDTQVARFQVSRDGGVTWKDHWTDAGANPGELRFSNINIDLAEYVGKEINIRFAYTIGFGQFFPATQAAVGWFIDDIAIANADELKNAVTTTLTAAAELPLVPASASPISIQARGKIFGDYGLEWGPLLHVVPVQPDPLVWATINKVAVTGPNQVEIEFSASASPSAAYVVQSATSLSQNTWSTEAAAVQSLGSGQFRAQLHTQGSSRKFYRVQSL